MSNDTAIITRVLGQLVGECRVCGCGGDACKLADGDRCCWLDQFKTLCSNPSCVMATVREQKKLKQQGRDREKQAASVIPEWMQRRKREEMARKRRAKKVKGRAA